MYFNIPSLRNKYFVIAPPEEQNKIQFSACLTINKKNRSVSIILSRLDESSDTSSKSLDEMSNVVAFISFFNHHPLSSWATHKPPILNQMWPILASKKHEHRIKTY